MASVCGGTLALMDAGRADQAAGRRHLASASSWRRTSHVLLTDIQGDEDHYGDMDFKVAGTQKGVTGIQLDIKIDGITEDDRPRGAGAGAGGAGWRSSRRCSRTLPAPRKEISAYAPRLLQVKINPEKIGLLIGPGGKMIRAIQEETGAKLDVEDDGTVSIARLDAAGAEEAQAPGRGAVRRDQGRHDLRGEGDRRIKEFGAFIEIAPGRDGLCHISELDTGYVGTRRGRGARSATRCR